MSQQQSTAAILTFGSWQDWEGRVVGGRFALGPYLGGSERSAVYLTDVGGVRAVVKLVAADSADAEAQLARWEAACRMAHPNLLRVFETGRWHADEERDMFYAVMEYADENLGEILRERALSAAETREVLAPALDALQHLHEQNLVLLDLKPSNVLAIGPKLKLAVDGVRRSGSRIAGGEQEDWRSAPEVFKSSVSARNDIWALGLLVVESLTKQRPVWDRAKDDEVKVPGGLPEPFASIAQGCLQRDPGKRCSLADVRKMLSRPTETKPAEVVPIRGEEGAAKQSQAVPAAQRDQVEPKVAKAVVEPSKPEVKKTVAPPPPAAAKVTAVREESVPKEMARGPEPYERYRGSLSLDSPESKNDSDGGFLEGKRRFVPVVIALLVAVLAVLGLVWAFGGHGSDAKTAVASQAPPAQSDVPASPQPEPVSAKVRPTSGGVANQVLPEISRSAQNSIHGVVKVRVQANVNEAGDVTLAGIAAHGPSRYFAKQALEAARQWKFAPPVVGGAPVPSRWNIEFAFKRSGVKAESKMVAPRV